MSAQEVYKRQEVKEAVPCFPEKTSHEFQASFRRLAAEEQFQALSTFRMQVNFARSYLDEDETLEKEVPIVELKKFFDVAHTESIRSALKAAGPEYRFMGKPSSLSDADFTDIVGWVTQAADDRTPMTLKAIVAKIAEVKHKRVSVDSLRMALIRRKTVKFINARPVEACRLQLDYRKIQRFLDETETLLRDVPPAFVFNMDETGINERANAKKKRVVVHSGFRGRQTVYPIPRNRRHSTVVACIAADGTAIPPLVVVTHRTTRDTLRLRCWGDDKVRFKHSQSGYITHDLFMAWLHDTFVPSVDERRRRTGNMEQTAYLLMDNCSSHRSNDIEALCRDNNIVLVYFVPNTTHIFQPLDLCFFAAFKAKLRSAVPDENVEDDQTQRLILLLTAWDEATKVETIRSSFVVAGFGYHILGERVVLSFSRMDVRRLERGPEEEEENKPPPRDRRLPINN